MKTQVWQPPEKSQDAANSGQIALADNIILTVIKPDSVYERSYTSTQAFLLAANLLNQREAFELYDENRELLVKSMDGELSGHPGYCAQLTGTLQVLRAVLISWLRHYERHLLSEAERLQADAVANAAAQADAGMGTEPLAAEDASAPLEAPDGENGAEPSPAA